MKNFLAVAMICLLFLTPASWAKKRKHHPDSSNSSFDYYLLAISWAPNYCAGHPSDHSKECQIGGRVAFVLHGLWPQSESGAPPMSCTPASPVAGATVDHMLPFMPSRGLIQHEWAKHGTCTGLAAQDYFQAVERAYTSVLVPEKYQQINRQQNLNVRDLEQSFAQANHAPVEAFRVSCHGQDFVGMEICLDKNLNYRACTESVRECRLPQVNLLPPQ
jgi:ribonuclease T2